MGLSAQGLKYLMWIKSKHGIKGPLLTFGNQDIYATQEDVMRWMKERSLPVTMPEEIHLSTSSGLKKLNEESQDFIHAKTFFEFLGVPSSLYYDIDKFEFDKPRIVHDLARPIDQRFHDTFNFVLDSGTLEHIFDIKTVMANIVKMTKKGGYVLQMIPAQNFLNHGFYQMSPTFFHDFYTENGFEIVEAHIIEIRGSTYRFHKYDQERDYHGMFFDPANRLVNSFLARKVRELGDVVSPDQYLYKKLAEDAQKVESDFFSRTWADKIVSFARRLVPIKYHGQFFKIYLWLKRMSAEKDFFDLKA